MLLSISLSFSPLFFKWNNHGYDIAKIFGNKFTLVSPVWLQVKRRGKERFQFTGLHDADQGVIFFFFEYELQYCCRLGSFGILGGFCWLCFVVKYFHPFNFFWVFFKVNFFQSSPASTCVHSLFVKKFK